MKEMKVGSVPAVLSVHDADGRTADVMVTVYADPECPQVILETPDDSLCLGLAEAEVLETAIRVARQSLRRR
jgi:hypothetical protein